MRPQPSSLPELLRGFSDGGSRFFGILRLFGTFFLLSADFFVREKRSVHYNAKLKFYNAEIPEIRRSVQSAEKFV
jgi:hypothetical protein